MYKKDQDLYAGLLIEVLAVILWFKGQNLSKMQGLFPRFLIILMAIAGLGIIKRSIQIYKRDGKPYSKLTLKDFLLQAAIPGAFLVVMAYFIKQIGFYLDVFIVMIGVCFIQDIFIGGIKSITLKKVIKAVIFSLIATGILYLCFAVLLKMSTPTGILGI